VKNNTPDLSSEEEPHRNKRQLSDNNLRTEGNIWSQVPQGDFDLKLFVTYIRIFLAGTLGGRGRKGREIIRKINLGDGSRYFWGGSEHPKSLRPNTFS
jgi:hypothetical protein